MSRRRTAAFRLATDLGIAGMHAGITLWHRLPMLAYTGTSPARSRELERMVTEKTTAATKGALAAQRVAVAAAAKAMTGRLDPALAAGVTAAALRPAFRTVKANARRLGKKR